MLQYPSTSTFSLETERDAILASGGLVPAWFAVEAGMAACAVAGQQALDSQHQSDLAGAAVACLALDVVRALEAAEAFVALTQAKARPAIQQAALETTVLAPEAANDSLDDDIPRLPKFTLRRAAAVLGLATGLGAVTAVALAPDSDVVLPAVSVITEQVLLSPASLPGDQPTGSISGFSQTEIVARGETLSSLLSKLGASDPDFIRFASADRVGKRLLQLQPGRTVTAEIDPSGRVLRLQYRHGNLEIDGKAPLRVTIVREADRFKATEAPVAVERSIEVRAAEVRTTLFAATDAAGIPDAVATRAADILSNSIDLRRDLRRGARLSVVWETVREVDSLDLPVPGKILAIELVSGSLRHEAVWFEHDDGGGAFYNFAGQSLARSFLREPIEFTRITSGFSSARLHPLFRDVRAHTGTDFAAPVGTRVRSVGDGVVRFAGYNGGYGRTVIIDHAGKVSTLYAHLNAFGDGIAMGARVAQGQVLGTVGMTGWTTGPHLHYEFLVNGRHVDPMKAVLPEGRKLSMPERMRFVPLSASYRERMAQVDQAPSSVARFE